MKVGKLHNDRTLRHGLQWQLGILEITQSAWCHEGGMSKMKLDPHSTKQRTICVQETMVVHVVLEGLISRHRGSADQRALGHVGVGTAALEEAQPVLFGEELQESMVAGSRVGVHKACK